MANGRTMTRPEVMGPPDESRALAAGSAGALAEAAEVGAMAAMAREKAQIETQTIIARKFPRDEMKAFDNIMKACKRPAFVTKKVRNKETGQMEDAFHALYRYPRAGENIDGPGVVLAREMARCWGNIYYGVRMISMDDDWIHIQGFAIDLQTNVPVVSEDKFKRLIFRKNGGWIRPDERDLRELINRRGAFCVRNALLQLMPPDFIEEAVQECKRTAVSVAKGMKPEDRDKTLRMIVHGFSGLGVTKEMIETYLGHTLESISAEELTDLRTIYSTVAEEPGSIDKYFERPKAAAPEKGGLDPSQVAGGTSQERSARPAAPPPPAAGPLEISPEEAERIRQREIAEARGDAPTAPPKPTSRGGELFPKA